MLFSFFLRIQEPPARPTDPSDKKEGHEIDSLAGVLDPKISKIYGAPGPRSRFASIIRDGLYFLLILA